MLLYERSCTQRKHTKSKSVITYSVTKRTVSQNVTLCSNIVRKLYKQGRFLLCAARAMVNGEGDVE